MKSEIVEILEKYGIVDETYLGCGATHHLSKVGLNINKKAKEIMNKEFAIQFEQVTQTLAIWNIKERVINHDSLDLYVKDNMNWGNITNNIVVHRVDIKKRSSGRFSLVAVMPFSYFEEFVKLNKFLDFGIDIDTKEFDDDDFQSVHISGNEKEGEIIYLYGKRYERNPNLRSKAIQLQGCKCKVCGFDFAEKYGTIGEGFIEVHHLKPLHEGEQQPDPLKDLICVCSNCHRMLHRGKLSTLSPDELKDRIRK